MYQRIWLWSALLKRTALDGTECNILHLDTEGIDVASGAGSSASELGSFIQFLSGFSGISTWTWAYASKSHSNDRAPSCSYHSVLPRCFNKGVVSTIISSWLSVEEGECQRAFDVITEVYMSLFDRSKPPKEAALREAHEDAVQKAVAAFNGTAVGNMERELRTGCHAIAADAKVDNVLKVLDGLQSKYESNCHGLVKWEKLTIFLKQSLEDPIYDLIKKQIDQVGSERSSLALKCRSIEDRMNFPNKQFETAEPQKSEYFKRYEDAINDKKKLADD
ncbi:hypothetical protein ACH5RR_032396 [Cinchona calisaya]|uniref:Guanylate-binding protein/Atlastin C-terminal domain-containing protein n=1 Tax=Cinchona calisaya TaxID=153742 RepID=A0ABD2YHX9_9GENT